jgi:mRNA-degrading endonuclease YafQ of YafQ-DinJ toxin-antitoxin module
MHHVHIVFSCTYQLHKLKQITKNSEKKKLTPILSILLNQLTMPANWIEHTIPAL